jgi:ketosteroid isomerase-like protein
VSDDDAVKQIEAANEELYSAFEAADLDRMGQLWVDGDVAELARCVHPGADAVSGRENVLRSWALVMANTDYLQFIVTDVRTSLADGLAVVTCTENILSTGTQGAAFGTGVAVATNGFVRHGGQWQMWLHHASPVLRHHEGGGA